MHDSQVLATYGISWAIAFLASICRSFRDSDYKSAGRLLGLGASSGFFAIGVIGVVWGDLSHGGGWFRVSQAYLYGASALIGLLSKEQDKYVKKFFGVVMVALKAAIDNSKEKKQ